MNFAVSYLEITWHSLEGSRDSAVVRALASRIGSILPGVLRGLSLLLVASCSEGVSPGPPFCLPAQNTNISKFQFDQDRGSAWKQAIYFLLILFREGPPVIEKEEIIYAVTKENPW